MSYRLSILHHLIPSNIGFRVKWLAVLVILGIGVTAQAQNLFTNGSFETNSLSGLIAVIWQPALDRVSAVHLLERHHERELMLDRHPAQ